MNRPPAHLFPSAPQAALLLLADFLLQYFISTLLYDLRGLLGLREQQLWAFVMLLSNGIVITAVLHFTGRSHRELLHHGPSSVAATLLLVVPPVMMLVPLIVLADFTLVTALEDIFPVSRWEERAFGDMASGTLPALVAVCVLAPVVEEMLFRGILLKAFLQRYPRGLAIGYSALYFGFAHLNVYQFALAFLLGLLLGWIYERFHSLLPCIALHAAVNTSVTAWEAMAPAATGRGPGEIPLQAWVVAAGVCVAGAFALSRLARHGRSPAGGTAA